MSEYLIQGESLTALADEIRVLSGTEGTMGLDAMKSNVNTANSAVSAALSVLVDKGVDVPDGSNVSGLAELIAALEVGGGSDVDLADMTFCRFAYVTPAQNITGKLSLGYYPPDDNIFAIGVENINGITLESSAVRAGVYVSKGWAMRLVSANGASTGSVPYVVNDYVSFNSKAYLQAGITYKYVVIGK